MQASPLLSSSAGCPHAPLPAQAKTRHLLSHLGLPGLAPLPADMAVPATTQALFSLTHSLRPRPGTHRPLGLFHGHSRTRSHAPHRICLETQTHPGPPPLWASSPLGPMNNSLLSLWASNIYPLRFPALSSLGEGPAFSVAPPPAVPGAILPLGSLHLCLVAQSCTSPSWSRALRPAGPSAVLGEADPGRELPTPAATSAAA